MYQLIIGGVFVDDLDRTGNTFATGAVYVVVFFVFVTIVAHIV